MSQHLCVIICTTVLEYCSGSLKYVPKSNVMDLTQMSVLPPKIGNKKEIEIFSSPTERNFKNGLLWQIIYWKVESK